MNGKTPRWLTALLVLAGALILLPLLLCGGIAGYYYWDAHSRPTVMTPVIKGKVVDAETGKPIANAYVRAEWDITWPQNWDFPGPVQLADDVPEVVTVWSVKSRQDGSFLLPAKFRTLHPTGLFVREKAGGVTVTVAALGRRLERILAYYPNDRVGRSAFGPTTRGDVRIRFLNTRLVSLGEVRLGTIESEEAYWKNLYGSGLVDLDNSLLFVNASYNQGSTVFPNPVTPLPTDYAFVLAEYANFLTLFPQSLNSNKAQGEQDIVVARVRRETNRRTVVREIRSILMEHPEAPGGAKLYLLAAEIEK